LIETSSGVREVRDAVGGAELSPDDTHLALWGAASQSLRGVPRGRVVLARVVDGAELHTLDFGDREIVRTLFTPEGALLVVHHEPRTNLVTVEWFDLHARERTGSLVLADLGELRQVDHAPNAHRALFCGLRGWSLVDLRGVGVVAQAAWADHQHNWSPYRDGNYIDAYVHPDGGSFVLDVNTSDESSTRHVVTVGKTAAQRVEVEGVIGQSARWIDRVHFADFADVPSSENECVVRVFDVERPYSHGEIFGAETEDIPQYIRELFLNLVDVAWTADGHRAVLCNRTRERPYECSVATVDLFGDTRPQRPDLHERQRRSVCWSVRSVRRQHRVGVCSRSSHKAVSAGGPGEPRRAVRAPRRVTHARSAGDRSARHARVNAHFEASTSAGTPLRALARAARRRSVSVA
jgi:hypothetical protein